MLPRLSQSLDRPADALSRSPRTQPSRNPRGHRPRSPPVPFCRRAAPRGAARRAALAQGFVENWNFDPKPSQTSLTSPDGRFFDPGCPEAGSSVFKAILAAARDSGSEQDRRFLKRFWGGRRSTTPRLVREVCLSESMDLLTGFSRLLRWRNLTKNQSILTDGSRRLALAKKPMDVDSPPVPGTENRTIKPPTQLWGEYFCRTLSDVPETNMGSHGPKSPDSQAPF